MRPGAIGGDLARELGPDRPRSARHEDRAPVQEVSHRPHVELHGCAVQEVLDLHGADVGEPDTPLEHVGHGRHDADTRGTRRAGGHHHLTHDRAGGARHRHHDLVDAFLLDRLRQDVAPSQDPHAVQERPGLVRIVVDHTHDPEPGHALVEDLVDQPLAGPAAAHDEHPLLVSAAVVDGDLEDALGHPHAADAEQHEHEEQEQDRPGERRVLRVRALHRVLEQERRQAPHRGADEGRADDVDDVARAHEPPRDVVEAEHRVREHDGSHREQTVDRDRVPVLLRHVPVEPQLERDHHGRAHHGDVGDHEEHDAFHARGREPPSQRGVHRASPSFRTATTRSTCAADMDAKNGTIRVRAAAMSVCSSEPGTRSSRPAYGGCRWIGGSK